LHSLRLKSLASLSAITVSSLIAFATLGCRGQISEKPPLFIKHGMEVQARLNAFEQNTFFADGRNMRHPPEGTLARGLLKEDDAYWRGGSDTGEPIAKIPFAVTTDVMARGQERFQIYCTPCHGQTGIGNGIVVQKGYLPPPNFSDARLLEVSDGYIYRAISNGIRNMPSYGKQIPEADRWAIVAYVRALQRSMTATEQDVPESQRGNLR
jgi:mono/diheme cytochrome c family protein